MSAFDRLQTDPFYFTNQAHATIQELSSKYDDIHYQPKRFNTLVSNTSTQVFRKVRNGRMPSNMYATPSQLKKWNLDPSKQVYDAPTRRKRWFNTNTDFVVPQQSLPAKPGFKRVIKWQEYEQDKVRKRLHMKKNPISFGGPMIGYMKAPMEYRPLTQSEMINHGQHAFYEDNYEITQ